MMGGKTVKNLLNNLIEVLGINDNVPEYSKYFKQFQVQEICCVPCQKPDIEQILRVIVNAEIIETKIVTTSRGISNEGQILTGKKLLVRGKLIQKIEYVADDPEQSVHAAEFEKLFSDFIVMDDYLECTTPVTVTPYIEDIYIKQINKRKVFKNVMLLINAVPIVCNPINAKTENELESSLLVEHQKSKYYPCKCKEYKYFTQFVAMEKIRVPCKKPDIEQIISVIVDPEIISAKVINTMRGVSREGQYLSGKKIVVELKIKQKILYVADVRKQSIHGIENEFYQSAYIVIPKFIEGTSPEILLKNKLLQPKLKVEDVYFKALDKRNIFKNITLYLEYCYIPDYEICYSHHNNCTSSNLWVIHENGDCNIQITYDEENKNIKPIWSPNGQEIAYLSNLMGKYMLYTMSLKNLSKRQLTFPDSFDSISSYCFTADGKKIIFSAVQNNCKEIFSVDINSTKWQQLTKGNGLINSYKPKSSPDGSKIAFLKSVNNVSNLWISDINGFNGKQITNCGYIKDFDWLYNNKLVYISGKGNTPDTIFFVNLNSLEIKKIPNCEDIYVKKCLKVSPDNRYIAFIGMKCNKNDIDDIYIYEISTKTIINITENSYGANISDLVWKIDSSKIYYSSNELGYYNIYSISLRDFYKQQLTNTTASNIQLSYRPRVK